MDEEFKVLLRRNLEIAKENNKLLKKMRRNAIIGNFIKIIWWAFLIGVPVVLYYYVLQPYFQELSELYSGVQTGVNDVREFFNRIPFIGDLIQNFDNASTSEQKIE